MIMKKSVIPLATLSLLVTAAACSKPQAAANTAYKQTDRQDDAAASSDTMISPAVSQPEYTDNSNLRFSDMDGITFCFASGVGAWSTTLNIHSDGTFTGYYHDSESGNGYLNPKGIVYDCKFNGTFTSLKKDGPYQYSLKCKTIEAQTPPGEIAFQDDIAHVSTKPYGFDDADEFELYLPGKQISELPSQFLAWTNGSAEGEVLDNYGLYNVKGQEGFIVWPESSETNSVTEETHPLVFPNVTYSLSEIDALQAKYADNDNLQLNDLDGYEFFSIKHGFIGPSLSLHQDGAFDGEYMAAFSFYNDDDTLNRIVCESKYNGKFTSLIKTAPYEYSLTCSSFKTEKSVGDVEIVDKEKHIVIEPCGFDHADKFILYLPGKKVSELPKELLEWSPELNNIGVITDYILYNVGGGNSFVIIPG